MIIHKIDFTGSFLHPSDALKFEGPHVAFIGRSNVGKSSLINLLCGRKNLARISKEPGKTRTMNFYYINDTWYLVDLPGYGYAKVSQSERKKWSKVVSEYLKNNPYLLTAFLLIDSSIPPQKIDIRFLDFIGKNRIPFTIIFTKSDKVKPAVRSSNIRSFQKEMLVQWEHLPEQFIVSSKTGKGKEELLRFIEQLIVRHYE